MCMLQYKHMRCFRSKLGLFISVLSLSLVSSVASPMIASAGTIDPEVKCSSGNLVTQRGYSYCDQGGGRVSEHSIALLNSPNLERLSPCLFNK